MRFYGDDDGLQLAFNFPFLDADLDATELAAVVARTEGLLPDGAWPLWTAPTTTSSASRRAGPAATSGGSASRS